MSNELSGWSVSLLAKYWRRLRICLLGLVSICVLYCVPDTTPPSNNLRLVLTTFRGQSFGNSLQTPIIVAAEAAGRVRFRMCLLLEIDHTDIAQVQIRPHSGTILSPTSPDLSEATFLKYKECQEKKKPCLIATMDSRRRELVVQVELLRPGAGGLFIGTLFQGDCSADDTFDGVNVLSRESFAIGQTFRNADEPTPDASSVSPDVSNQPDSPQQGADLPDASGVIDLQQPLPTPERLPENSTGSDGG